MNSAAAITFDDTEAERETFQALSNHTEIVATTLLYRDKVAFSETAQTLKSSSRNLGAEHLAYLCEKLECST